MFAPKGGLGVLTVVRLFFSSITLSLSICFTLSLSMAQPPHRNGMDHENSSVAKTLAICRITKNTQNQKQEENLKQTGNIDPKQGTKVGLSCFFFQFSSMFRLSGCFLFCRWPRVLRFYVFRTIVKQPPLTPTLQVSAILVPRSADFRASRSQKAELPHCFHLPSRQKNPILQHPRLHTPELTFLTIVNSLTCATKT